MRILYLKDDLFAASDESYERAPYNAWWNIEVWFERIPLSRGGIPE